MTRRRERYDDVTPAVAPQDDSVDLGRYEERTVLAWHRTALAIIGGAMMPFRLTYGDGPPWLLAVIVGAALLAVLSVTESRHRYPGDRTRRADVRDRGGRLGALVALSVTLLLLAELALVLSR
ncbi:MAG: DUF202 domain-containing protein [Dermatophilaceae bacterium]|nr:DUF202 domain-containing protein [Intrasporangiaceae bacterium]